MKHTIGIVESKSQNQNINHYQNQTQRKKEEKIYLQKPQFKSTNKDSNFVELDQEKDVN